MGPLQLDEREMQRKREQLQQQVHMSAHTPIHISTQNLHICLHTRRNIRLHTCLRTYLHTDGGTVERATLVRGRVGVKARRLRCVKPPATIMADRSTIMADHGTVMADQGIIMANCSTIMTDHSTVMADCSTIMADSSTVITIVLRSLEGGLESKRTGFDGGMCICMCVDVYRCRV